MSSPFLATNGRRSRVFSCRGIAMTTAQVDEIVNHPLEATAAWLSDVAGDPVAFVEGAFPWGEGELANFNDPRAHLAGTHEQTWRIDLQPWNPNRPEASPARCRS